MRRSLLKKSKRLRVDVFADRVEIYDGKERLILTGLDLVNKGITLGSTMTLCQRKNGRWYVRFWLNGQRRMLSTGEIDYDKALLKVKEILDRAEDPKASHRKPSITFSQLATEFEHHIEKRWMPSTVENDKSRLKNLRKEFGNKTLSEITEHQLIAYLERRKDKTVVRIKEGTRYEQKIDVSTVNRELTSIKLIFKFAVDKGYVTTNPAGMIKPFPILPNNDGIIDSNERRPLIKDELNRLLEACKVSDNPILYEIVVVAVLSGLRKGELRRLTWDDVDFERNLLRVRQSKTKTVFYKPMPDELREVLLALRGRYPHSQYVFCKADGTAYGDWRGSFKTVCRWVGLEDVCFHMLRHTCFSMLGDKGFNELEIKAYSGHKSTAMVRRYTHLSSKHVQEMANTLSLNSGAKVVQLGDGS